MRIGFYVDGFNIYGAVNDIIKEHIENRRPGPAPHHLKWLSYRTLCEFLAVRIGHRYAVPTEIANIHFFTTIPEPIYNPAGIITNDGPRSRHEDFVRALEHQGVQIHHGKFKELPLHWCPKCQSPVTHCGNKQHVLKPKLCEKETDVSLAVRVVADAVAGHVDCVVVLSTDSDLAPMAKLVHIECPGVKVVSVAVSPRRHSKAVLTYSHQSLSVDAAMLERNLLPPAIQLVNGEVLNRPSKYHPPKK